MAITLSEVDKKVIRGLRAAVADRGEDWVYPNRIERNHDPDWTDGTGSCYNLLLDGSAACVIGYIAVDQSLPTTRNSSAPTDAKNWGVSAPIFLAMGIAQDAQDRGEPWGVAAGQFYAILDKQVPNWRQQMEEDNG